MPDPAKLLSKQTALARIRISAGDKGIAECSQFFRRMLAADLHDLGACKLIAVFVVGMPHMALKPLPGDSMPRNRFMKPLPQILVFHRLAVNRLPIVGFPTWQPIGDALAKVFGISE